MEEKLLFTSRYNDTLEVSSNYGADNGDDWERAIGKEDPFFVEITEQDFTIKSTCIALTLEQATELRDFLTEKIDYLTQK